MHMTSPAPLPPAPRPPPAPQPSELSPRQLEVAVLIAKGFTAKEIGGLLGIKGSTVKNHSDRLRLVLGVNRITEIAVWATKHGLT